MNSEYPHGYAFNSLCADPYKDYFAEATPSEGGMIYGRIAGISDVVPFHGCNVQEARKAFCAAVDRYIVFIEEMGEPGPDDEEEN